MTRALPAVVCLFLLGGFLLPNPSRNDTWTDEILHAGLSKPRAIEMLKELTLGIGARPSGSAQAERAIDWAGRKMKDLGLENVHLEPVKVPHWVRGKSERATMIYGSVTERLSVCALGNSIATPKSGITAEVVEVMSLKEAEELGERGRGKIVFYNRPLDPTQPKTFAAYGGAVDQRSQGAISAAKSGAVAVLVRSMTLAKDDVPHTGYSGYDEKVRKIPTAALGIRSANKLSEKLKENPHLQVRLELDCKLLPDVMSSNVVGEIVGREKPGEVVLIGAHLDSWDLGQGAHDDGAGCVHSLEAARLLKESGFRPKRTIRVVLFMDEENGGGGGREYEAAHRRERHVAAIESDDGGFMPRAFTTSAMGAAFERIKGWLPALGSAGIERVSAGGGGTDIDPLAERGAILFGLEPDNQRYFDFHHSANDTFDKVHPRELELGAIAIAILARLLSEELP